MTFRKFNTDGRFYDNPQAIVPTAASGAFGFTQVEVNIGTKAMNGGSFTIPVVGMTPGKAVLMLAAVAAFTGKGTLLDELEFDQVIVSAVVETSTLIRCVWASTGYVLGNFKFNYVIGV